MKGTTWIIVILGILTFLFIIPPSIKCKIYFWDKNACSQVGDILTNLGVDPNATPVTQFDEFTEAFQQS